MSRRVAFRADPEAIRRINESLRKMMVCWRRVVEETNRRAAECSARRYHNELCKPEWEIFS